MTTNREISQRTRYVRPLLVALMLMGTMLFVPAAPSSAATVYKVSSKGDTLSAVTYTDDGCTFASESVDVVDSKNAEPTFYYFAYGSDCTGGTWEYYGTGTPDTYDFAAHLSGAHIEAADFVIYNYYSGEPVGKKSLDLTWTGTGPVTKEAYKSKITINGQYKESYRISGTSRSASVTGTFDGGGTLAVSATATHTITFE